MNTRTKSAFRYGFYAMSLGTVLSVIALIAVVSQSGAGQPSSLCNVLVYLGYWPSLLAGRSAHDLFVSFWIVPANVIAWGVVGFVAGLIRPSPK